MTGLSIFSKIALRNIFRNWRRSLAVILSIGSGFAAINLFEGYMTDVRFLFDHTYSKRLMYGQILIQRSQSLDSGIGYDSHLISLDDQRSVAEITAKIPEVKNSVRFLHISGLANSGDISTVFQGLGYDVEAGLRMREPNWTWNTLAGSPLDQGIDDPRNIVIGQGLGRMIRCLPLGKTKKLDFKNGYSREPREIRCEHPNLELNVTSQAGQMNATSVKVYGILDAVYRELDLRFVTMSLPKAQELLGTDEISLLSLQLEKPAEAERWVRILNERIRARGLDLKAIEWQKHPFGELYIQSVDFLNVFRNFTLFVTLAIIALSVFSLLTRLIQERTREIGTLRCLGFHRDQIRKLFLIEGFFLSALGSSFGALMTLLFAPIANSIRLEYKIGILSEKVPFQIAVLPTNFIYSGIVLSLIALLAAEIAIERSLRKSIPSALTQV